MKKTDNNAISAERTALHIAMYFVLLGVGGYMPIGLDMVFNTLTHRTAGETNPFVGLLIPALIGASTLGVTVWKRSKYMYYSAPFNFGFIAYLGLAFMFLPELNPSYKVVSVAYATGMTIPIAMLVGRGIAFLQKGPMQTDDPSMRPRFIGKVIVE